MSAQTNDAAEGVEEKASAPENDAQDAAAEQAEANAQAGEDAVAGEAEAEPEAAEGGEGAEGTQADPEAQLAEMKDKYLRLQAEWDNFRKRTAAEREQESARANERLVSNLLAVVDDMERAINGSGVAEDDPMLAGIKAVHSKFVDILSREGLTAIDPAKGDAFDIHCHQAVQKVEDASVPDESIVEVYQKGYTMGDKNLRPAMVVVSCGGPKREA